jgi:hypothetical protein
MLDCLASIWCLGCEPRSRAPRKAVSANAAGFGGHLTKGDGHRIKAFLSGTQHCQWISAKDILEQTRDLPAKYGGSCRFTLWSILRKLLNNEVSKQLAKNNNCKKTAGSGRDRFWRWFSAPCGDAACCNQFELEACAGVNLKQIVLGCGSSDCS